MTLLSAVGPVDETPIDRYIAEQASLTAVDRFSQRHEHDLVPSQARYYRDLIPLSRPGPGQQYAFEVDLDACTGCKACVAACHSLNGLDEGESWRSVSMLRGVSADRPFQQTVTAACHHCVDPACLNGCPVDAYEKDPVTGIVSHLDDQCIGCGYCTLTCPYEVPVMNPARGIVRKCDMCKDRLAENEAPACVQACPNGAITITLVDTAAAVAAAASGSLVPGAPPSAITSPTTVYRTARQHTLDELGKPGDGRDALQPAQPHPPLAAMLVLTQLSVGAFLIDLLLRATSGRGFVGSFDAVVAVVAGAVALAASVFHLGRPRLAYRAVIGLRHSWLSREVVAFGAFTALAGLYAFMVSRTPTDGRPATAILGAAAAGLGLAGIGCSVLIYTTTRRSSWRPLGVTARFVGTAVVGGLATVIWASLLSSPSAGARPLALVLGAVSVAKLAGEASVFVRGANEATRRARLLTGPLRTTTALRFGIGAVAGVILPVLVATAAWHGQGAWPAAALATLALGGVVAGELLERSLFFTTASAAG